MVLYQIDKEIEMVEFGSFLVTLFRVVGKIAVLFFGFFLALIWGITR